VAERLGRRLRELVLGGDALAYVKGLHPTAILLGVDETVLDLPWELFFATDAFGPELPMGRIVATQSRPAPRRDPLREDRDVVLLVVANPTSDLGAITLELEALRSLAGRIGPANVVVEVLAGREATRARLAAALRDGRVDILHFAGHARFDERRPGASALLLADGELRADDVLRLQWKAPPYLVFDSACETGRAGRGRLVSRTRRATGLPAAFLAMGVQGYVGHFFTVPDAAAAIVAGCFYETMLKDRSVGAALTRCREAVRDRYEASSDLTCFGLTYFGDVAGDERPALPMAV
jgi:CHAT domain-containing protein